MSALAWSFVIVLACVTGVGVWLWLRREGEMIAPLPIGLTALGLYIIPRAAYLLWFDRAPLTSGGLREPLQLALIAETTLAALVAALAFLVGHHAHSARRFGAQLRLDIPEPDPTRVIWVGGVAAAVGTLVIVYLLTSLGNLSYALSHQYEINVLLEGKQSLFQFTRLVVVAVILLLVDPVSGKSRWWVWLLAASAALALLPFGYRVFVLLAAGSPIALYHLTVRRLRLRWMVAAGALGGIALFLVGFVRLLTFERVEDAAVTFVRRPVTAVHFAFNATGELKIFDATSIVVRDVPRVVEYNYGGTFARVPWMIIPRRLWRDKPFTSGHLIVQRYLPNLRTAYPPMAVGEFFAAAGWLGVLLGFFGLGWGSRVVWAWHRRHGGSGNASVYLLYCFFVFDFIRVGDPSRTIWFLVIGATMTAIAFTISASWRRPPEVVLSNSTP